MKENKPSKPHSRLNTATTDLCQLRPCSAKRPPWARWMLLPGPLMARKEPRALERSGMSWRRKLGEIFQPMSARNKKQGQPSPSSQGHRCHPAHPQAPGTRGPLVRTEQPLSSLSAQLAATQRAEGDHGRPRQLPCVWVAWPPASASGLEHALSHLQHSEFQARDAWPSLRMPSREVSALPLPRHGPQPGWGWTDTD